MRNALIAVSVLAVAGIAAFFLSQEETPPPAPPAPPPVVEAPAPPPAPPPPVVENTDAVRAALLGLDKKPEEPPPPPATPQPRRRRTMHVVHEDVPEETVLTDYAFQSTLGNWRGVKQCLEETEAATKTDIQGAVKLAFAVKPNGSAQPQLIHVTKDTPKRLTDCVVAQAAKVSFPAFTANTVVTKEAKFVF